jgi:N-acetylglucosamine-6-phosphate deacetylase
MDAAGDALKIMCLAPEIPGNLEIIKRLKDNNIIAAFGHSDANYEESIKGFDAGIDHVTHFFNAMRSVHHRDPGPIPAILENSGISVEIIGDSHHVHPSLIRMVNKIKDPACIVCISDGISGVGLPEGIYTYNNMQYKSRDGLARYLDGTFIGSTMSLAKIARNYLNFTSSGLRKAIDTVTINPARILGIDDRKGSIEAGKDGDIVLLDKELNVRHTIIAGKLII